ncbi:MAG TPA: hypothetical protein VNG51_18930 [Ktedonobacteraceae bacterium]|nr:hypothetical protein [Ktedonobacteraceae bacterium]
MSIVLVATILIAFVVYHIIGGANVAQALVNATPTPTTAPITATGVPTTNGPTALPPVQNPGSILGIDGKPTINYPGISWIRLGYPTCGNSSNSGKKLQANIEQYHAQGIRVMLTFCQSSTGAGLFDTQQLNDAAQGGADAVQCGNEQMKQNAATMYIAPADFAKFYDLCESAMHAVNPNIPVILGSLDPQLAGTNYQQMQSQIDYLNQMQQAMNTQVHPGGHWDWHTQIIGLIDSWHNGYPNAYTNNLYGLFAFWAQQLHVNLNSGTLGKHLWVIEGTGCFKDCGIDASSAYQVAVSHILTLITDVQTTMKYHVPFFYFSGTDFNLDGVLWPIGVLNTQNQSKPLRQDLAPGARKLTLTCSSGQVTVADQETLLAKLYSGCTLPSNYASILTS